MDDDVKQMFANVDAYKALYGQRYHDAANQNDRDAVEVAKLIIQSLLLLHGGALLAIPAFVSIRPGVGHHTLLTLLCCFSFGVIAALFAGLLAFFALAERSVGHSTLVGAIDERAWARAASLKFLVTRDPAFRHYEAESNAAADTIDKEAEPHFTRYLCMRKVGIFLVVLSIIAFVVASFVATTAF